MNSASIDGHQLDIIDSAIVNMIACVVFFVLMSRFVVFVVVVF